jgi:hypothetical protein
MMSLATQAVHVNEAPRRPARPGQARTAAGVVRVSRAPRRQARTAAQVVRESGAQREPGGKWGGRPARPIQ